MKIVTYGNISLDEYKNTTFTEECELAFESIEIPTEIDFLSDEDDIATEGIWDITKGAMHAVGNTYNIAKTTTKGVTQLAGTMLRKTNDILRFFNNQLKQKKRIKKLWKQGYNIYFHNRPPPNTLIIIIYLYIAIL